MEFAFFGINDFSTFFTLMESSFPATERRSKEDAFAIFANHPLYHVIGYKENKTVRAFLAYWQFDECTFIDHLAVDLHLRGQGIGSELMRRFLKTEKGIVVLEVEPVEDETARKRVNFYEHLGLFLNDFPYTQPSMQVGQPEIPLKIMSYPKPVTEKEFKFMRRQIFKNCYKRDR